MDERTTGATDEQIEATARHYYAMTEVDPETYVPWERVGKREKAVLRDWAEDILSATCPPGFAIVPVSPVRADREAVVEAVTRVLEVVRLDKQFIADGFADEDFEDTHLFAAIQAVTEDDLAVLDSLRATPEPELAE